MEHGFEWDPIKANTNIKKHGISFELATDVFDDPMAVTIFDEDASHSEEDRWITIGLVQNKLYVVAVHTYKDVTRDSLTIRIISARLATKHEIKQYEETNYAR